MIKKLATAAREECQDAIPSDPWLINNCPLLVEYLTSSRYEDKSPRTTSTLTVFVDAGVLKIALNDRDANASLYVTGECLSDALESLEKQLNEQKPDWRQWKRKKGPR